MAFPPLKAILLEHAHEGRELDFLMDSAKNGKEGISKPIISFLLVFTKVVKETGTKLLQQLNLWCQFACAVGGAGYKASIPGGWNLFE